MTLSKKLRKGDGTFARDQIRAVAQRVEVVSKKEVRIRWQRSELRRTLTAASGVNAAVPGVRGFEPKWRARRDSNLQPIRLIIMAFKYSFDSQYPHACPHSIL